MAYRITKDCGTGWDDWCASNASSWGVSDRQCRSARNVHVDDVFLHYIDGVRAWAGYSRVVSPMRENDRDSAADWRNALSFVIPVERVRCLSAGQCQLTRELPELSHKNVHRQPTFSVVSESDAVKIKAAIDKSSEIPPTELSQEFSAKWHRDAESYYSDILSRQADGKCSLCDMTAEEWIKKLGLTDPLTDAVKFGFLDLAHITPRRNQGAVAPDNIRPLCPNCHRVVDRLGTQRCEEILRTDATHNLRSAEKQVPQGLPSPPRNQPGW